ncbi:MAG: hypothetical protein IJF49_07005 [Clostridia bacterium]|nr:hypothetical protein [Clostridia bacterium]
MKNRAFGRYYLFSLLGVLLASVYPIYMGVSVVEDMLRLGTVYAEDYPKYIIPYTPIALAVLVGVALIPLMIRLPGRFAQGIGSGISLAVFFASEFLLERLVTVTRTVTGTFSTLENWQMYMCYIPPADTVERTWTEVNVLMGEYSPAFKLHFYLISVVLIVSLLNCFYGFAQVVLTGSRGKCKPLIVQAAASAAFLAMCIWACFTAFYRTGELQVSALSAVLMSIFFVLFGITVGIYAASFVLGKPRILSEGMPAFCASAVTLLMYVGEMVLLSGNLYRFGEGWFFSAIGGIVLAPIDLVIVLMSGGVTALAAFMMARKRGD